MGVEIRAYEPGDENSWLRCRVLSFLGTAYFDDVVTKKPTYEGPSTDLVAVVDDAVVGVLDVAVDDDRATIETIAVHPDHARRGIGAALLARALDSLSRDVTVVDAWTRDDAAANAWYQREGFVETFRYLHVYASGDEADRAVAETAFGLTPVAGFFHAMIDRETELRQHFRRVHVCRQYERSVPLGSRG